LSGLIYMNDDYKGGGLHFPLQDLTIQPKQGMLVFFPSFHTHLHASLEIKEGTKYAIVTWFK
jgi:predicted 2-oxoglutarate/Fe(II)-dependent dioxygenase YbiX